MCRDHRDLATQRIQTWIHLSCSSRLGASGVVYMAERVKEAKEKVMMMGGEGKTPSLEESSEGIESTRQGGGGS